MQRRTRILAAVALLAVGVLIISRALRPPIYRELSLPEWLDAYSVAASLEEPRINALITSPEPIPTPSPRATLAAAAVKSMRKEAEGLCLKWLHTSRPAPFGHEADKHLYRGFVGLLILKPDSATAMTEVANIASDPNAPGGPFAMRLLAEMGPRGVPGLTNLLVSAQKPIAKERALRFLGTIPPGDEVALPALLAGLQSTDAAVARDAALLLGDMHKKPDTVVPALIAALEAKDYSVRIAAANALAEYKGEASAAVPVLQRAAKESWPGLRQYFTESLKRIQAEGPAKTSQ